MSIDTLTCILQSSTSHVKSCFSVIMTRVWKGSYLIVPGFCDQVLAKLDVEFCSGTRNLALPLEVVREFCTVRFDIVGSEELQCRC